MQYQSSVIHLSELLLHLQFCCLFIVFIGFVFHFHFFHLFIVIFIISYQHPSESVQSMQYQFSMIHLSSSLLLLQYRCLFIVYWICFSFHFFHLIIIVFVISYHHYPDAVQSMQYQFSMIHLSELLLLIQFCCLFIISFFHLFIVIFIIFSPSQLRFSSVNVVLVFNDSLI